MSQQPADLSPKQQLLLGVGYGFIVLMAVIGFIADMLPDNGTFMALNQSELVWVLLSSLAVGLVFIVLAAFAD